MEHENVTPFPSAHFGKRNGNGGSDLEARVAKLESSTEYIQREITDIKVDVREIRNNQRTDFRLLFGALITVAIGLASLIAKGFGWI